MGRWRVHHIYIHSHTHSTSPHIQFSTLALSTPDCSFPFSFCTEILLWWGIFVLASGQFHLDGGGDRNGLWGYFTILSPLLTMLILLLGSGMPTAEGTNQARFIRTPAAKLEYLSYRDQTSPLVPLPPSVYLRLPLWCKRWFLFEWTMYEMNWDYVEGGKGMAAVATTAVSGEGRRK